MAAGPRRASRSSSVAESSSPYSPSYSGPTLTRLQTQQAEAVKLELSSSSAYSPVLKPLSPSRGPPSERDHTSPNCEAPNSSTVEALPNRNSQLTDAFKQIVADLHSLQGIQVKSRQLEPGVARTMRVLRKGKWVAEAGPEMSVFCKQAYYGVLAHKEHMLLEQKLLQGCLQRLSEMNLMHQDSESRNELQARQGGGSASELNISESSMDLDVHIIDLVELDVASKQHAKRSLEVGDSGIEVGTGLSKRKRSGPSRLESVGYVTSPTEVVKIKPQQKSVKARRTQFSNSLSSSPPIAERKRAPKPKTAAPCKAVQTTDITDLRGKLAAISTRLKENRINGLRNNLNFPFGALPPNTQVAYRPPENLVFDAGEEEWIQCHITNAYITSTKSGAPTSSGTIYYDIQDPEPDEFLTPGKTYKGVHRSEFIVIPAVGCELTPYSAGTQVLARYPDTTTFYSARVMGMHKPTGQCILEFHGENEDGQEQLVDRRFVLAKQ